MKKSKRTLIMIISIILFIIISLIIYFNISFSPLRREFNTDLTKIIEENKINKDEILKEFDVEKLPHAIKMYLLNNGYIGKPKFNYVNINFKDVDFKSGKDKSLNIDYSQYNFSKKPIRIAFIDSSMIGIPFEGYDYYNNGIGRMRGVIAKSINLFDQKGEDMDKASLSTYLGESLFIPSSIFNNNIRFEEINKFKVRAFINYQDIEVSGVFTFNEKYEMISFETRDRAVVKEDGTVEYIPWKAECSDYKLTDYGINFPTKLKAIWQYEESDLIYFNGKVNNLYFK